MKQIKDNIEPEALERLRDYAAQYGEVPEATGQSMALHSIAISLKRIADTLEKSIGSRGVQLR